MVAGGPPDLDSLMLRPLNSYATISECTSTDLQLNHAAVITSIVDTALTHRMAGTEPFASQFE